MPKKSVSRKTKSQDEKEETITVVTPEVCVDHDDESYYITIELPGVAKGHVDLSVGEQSVCVEAMREDIAYLGCFSLAHSVDESKAKATFDNGLLKLTVPLKAPIKGKRIEIE
jgi:HSP20 family protein